MPCLRQCQQPAARRGESDLPVAAQERHRRRALELSDKTFPVANIIVRLNDLLLLAYEANEEANSYLQTTTATTSFSKSAGDSVNFNDAADCFKLAHVTVGVDYEIGTSFLSTNTPVTRTVVQVSGGIQTRLASGVVIVGWLEDCGTCNPEGELGISIPFGTGAFWVNDSVYPAENPKRRVTIKRGGCLRLEGEPVESEL